MNHSVAIDKGLASAVDKLTPFVKLGDGAHDLQDAVDDLKATLMSRTAHQAMAEDVP